MTLVEQIQEKAKIYINDTEIDAQEHISNFPMSIVDFVLEYAYEQCHFPTHFSDEDKEKALARCKNSIAMACVDIYLKAGAEGQTQYTSNSVQRSFKNEWITKSLLDKLPNYVNSI